MRGGFRLLKDGEALETVHASPITVHLLAHGDGMEILRQDLEPHAIVGMRPEDGWTALETIYVLSGRLRIQGRGTEVVAGVSISAHPVREPLLLEALEPSSILYISSQPIFHLYSGDIQGLLQLATDVEEKDGYTRDHCRRIQSISLQVGQALGFSEIQMYALSYGSFLHDIGKARIPASILGKPGPLEPDEWEVMKSHVDLGADILAERAYLASAVPIVRQHHERLDGSGYPRGLRGDDISQEARVVAVADTYDAMTTNRAYRVTPGPAAARRVLEESRGVTLDSAVVDAFMDLLDSKAIT